MRFALVLAMILGCGCGDNESVPWEPASGSRLKLRTYVYEGGTRQIDLAWFHDASRDERCAARRWSDGASYCTPESEPAVFVESTCMEALGRVAAGATPPPYFARQYHVQGEPLPSRLARAGSLAPPPADLWQLRDGVCEGPVTALGNYDYYALEEDISSTQLVRIKHSEPIGDNLAIIIATSEDGLRVPLTLFDRDDGECVPELRPNATSTQCAPRAAGEVSYFHDPECTVRELSAQRHALPTLGVHHDADSNCTTYYTIGEEVTAPPLYELVAGRCLEVAPPGGNRFFKMGPQTYVNVMARARRAGARLELIELTDFLIPDALLFDSLLGADCARTELMYGELRCVPATDAVVLPYFADGGCQQPIELALVPSGSCDATVAFARRGQEIVSLAGPYADPIYELSTGDRCGLYVPPQRFVAHAIGATVPVERFAKASLVIAP